MGGSINLANVAIGFDASKIQRGVDMSAAEMRKLGSVVKDSESDIDKYASAMKLLDIAQQKGAITADRLAAAQEQLAKKYGVETYAMIEARQAAEKLAAANERLEESKKREAQEIQRHLMLTRSVMTGVERHSAAIREFNVT